MSRFNTVSSAQALSTVTHNNCKSVNTVSELLTALGGSANQHLPMLIWIAGIFAKYLQVPLDKMAIEMLLRIDRVFLKYPSICEHIVYVEMLLREATTLGWRPPGKRLPEVWKLIHAVLAETLGTKFVYFAIEHDIDPLSLSVEDLAGCCDVMVTEGTTHEIAKRRQFRFLRSVLEAGLCDRFPKLSHLFCRIEFSRYGIRITDFPKPLRDEVNDLIDWTEAEMSENRSKEARHKPVTTRNMTQLISQIYGFRVNVRHLAHVSSLADLLDPKMVSEYIRWSVNKRKVDGPALRGDAWILYAAVSRYPALADLDFGWFKKILSEIPDSDPVIKGKREARQTIRYSVLESMLLKMEATCIQNRNRMS